MWLLKASLKEDNEVRLRKVLPSPFPKRKAGAFLEVLVYGFIALRKLFEIPSLICESISAERVFITVAFYFEFEKNRWVTHTNDLHASRLQCVSSR